MHIHTIEKTKTFGILNSKNDSEDIRIIIKNKKNTGLKFQNKIDILYDESK